MDRRIIPILFVTFVNSIGFSIVIPIAPFIIQQYGGGAFLYGLILSAYSICQYLAAPFMGSLSDKYGRRPLLIISHFGTLLSWGIFAIALNAPEITVIGMSLPLWIMITARICDGITGGNLSVANAYVADITHPDERTKAYGYVAAAYGIGFMMGPIVGSYSSNIGLGYMGTVYVAAMISIVTLFTLVFFLPESAKHISLDKNTRSLSDEFKKAFRYVFSILSYPSERAVKIYLHERTIVAFIFTLFTSVFSLYLIDSFGMTSRGIGYMFLVVGLFQVVDQGWLVPLLVKKIGEDRAIRLSLYIIIIFSFLVPVYSNIRSFLIVVFFIVFGFSIHFTILKSILLRYTPHEKHGEIVGVEESLIAFNQGVVPIVAGLMYAHLSNTVFMFASIPLIIFMLIKRYKFKETINPFVR